jgi:AcrR family transcriptional regulator
LQAILEQPGDPIERLRRGLIAYVHFGLDNPHHYRATFMMPLPEGFDEAKHKKADSPGMQAFDFLRRCVFDCISAGKIHSKDPELVSQTLWCGAHGVTALLITHEAFPWVDRQQIIEYVIDSIIAGVARKAK